MLTVSPVVDFPEIEKKILAFWSENGIFKKTLSERKGSKEFLFYDGPPFATGLPHYGHLLAGTLKDIVPRYQTMKGNFVERRFGWDTHGLPIEMLVEKDLGLNGRQDILKYGIAKFNEACRAGVLKYVKEWEQITTRLGRWIDFEDDYKTMDTDFMESVWWVFKKLWDNDRVYETTRVMPYSWRLSTTLSQSEASSNYKEVQDPAITVRFKIIGADFSILAWTTTPWTLPSNMAICVGPEIEYSEVITKDEKVVLATKRVEAYFGKDAKISRTILGKELDGLKYEPLLPFYEDKSTQGAFVVVTDEYVTTEDGTGVVHQSPAHGEDDHRIGKKFNIPLVDPIDEEGNFKDPVTPFKGMNIKEADKHIIKLLKEKNKLFKQDTLTHSYPFCERSGTPLIYKAVPAWYVKVEDISKEMCEHNEKIRWVPDHVGNARFANWLKDARDWNISRSRFWGNPLPIWRCESCGNLECLGSKKELEEKSGTKVTDLHKHFIDELKWNCEKCSATMKRVPEVLDCWFESGSMPYAQLHYPFENKERFENAFPADFIAEGLDQTRGWFYTLMILGTSLFKKPPFKNVIVNGLILAEDGKKMSKSLKNYPDPLKVLDELGADALRLYMINSPVVRAEPLRFSGNGVKEILRMVLIPLWNVYSFFTTYANIDNYKPSPDLTSSKNELDQWIISRFQTLLTKIEKEMEEYRLYAVVPALLDFLEELTNWYVRRSRRRFWSDNLTDKQNGYDTLYYILNGFSKALAPFLPFVTEEIYQNLSTLTKDSPESIHLTEYPVASEKLVNADLESAMWLIKETVQLGRALRSSLKLAIRQPLNSITVITKSKGANKILASFEDHIKEELNVKSVLYSSEEEKYVEKTVKPNFPVVGPRMGKRMGELSKALLSLSNEQLLDLESGRSISIIGETISSEEVIIQRKAKGNVSIETAHGVTVFLDTNLTKELINEGYAREFINRVQRMRKEAGFEVTDRISVVFNCEKTLADAVAENTDFIKGEILATEIKLSPANNEVDRSEEHEIDSRSITIGIKK